MVLQNPLELKPDGRLQRWELCWWTSPDLTLVWRGAETGIKTGPTLDVQNPFLHQDLMASTPQPT